MAIKKVKLTEADLNRIVKKVMNEARPPRIANRAAGQQQGSVATSGQSIAASNNPKIKALAVYLKQNQIKPADIGAAFQIVRGQGVSPKPVVAKPQQQGGNFMNNIRQGIKTVQGYQQQGVNKLSQGLNSVANAVKPKTQGGVARAAQPTSGSAQGTTKSVQPTSGSAQGTTTQSQAQMTPEQLKAIQGQAKRV
jgi:hypothetical protein